MRSTAFCWLTCLLLTMLIIGGDSVGNKTLQEVMQASGVVWNVTSERALKPWKYWDETEKYSGKDKDWRVAFFERKILVTWATWQNLIFELQEEEKNLVIMTENMKAVNKTLADAKVTLEVALLPLEVQKNFTGNLTNQEKKFLDEAKLAWRMEHHSIGKIEALNKQIKEAEDDYKVADRKRKKFREKHDLPPGDSPENLLSSPKKSARNLTKKQRVKEAEELDFEVKKAKKVLMTAKEKLSKHKSTHTDCSSKSNEAFRTNAQLNADHQRFPSKTLAKKQGEFSNKVRMLQKQEENSRIQLTNFQEDLEVAKATYRAKKKERNDRRQELGLPSLACSTGSLSSLEESEEDQSYLGATGGG